MLRSISMGEADRLVTVLTPSLGKLRVTVRGARRIKSRLGGHLDVLNRVRLALALGHRFDVVTGAEVAEPFAALKDDLDRLSGALYVTELADRLLPELSPHPSAYTLVLEALRVLEAGGDPDLVGRYMELRMLEDSGYLPELGHCLVCGSDLDPGHHRFAPVLGGTVDDVCVVPVGRVMPLSVDALKVLRHFARVPLTQAVRLKIAPPLVDEMASLMAASVHEVTDRDVASAAFVDDVRRLHERE